MVVVREIAQGATPGANPSPRSTRKLADIVYQDCWGQPWSGAS